MFRGCKQTKCPFFRKFAPKNAPMPPMSRISPDITNHIRKWCFLETTDILSHFQDYRLGVPKCFEKCNKKMVYYDIMGKV